MNLYSISPQSLGTFRVFFQLLKNAHRLQGLEIVGWDTRKRSVYSEGTYRLVADCKMCDTVL